MHPSILVPDWNCHPRVKAAVICKGATTDLLDLPEPPRILTQVHGNQSIQWTNTIPYHPTQADACFTSTTNIVLAIRTADCLPILITNVAGSLICAIHAGWRGLANKIITKTVNKLNQKPDELLVWLGPAIGAKHYIVGSEVYNAFECSQAFEQTMPNQWHCDLYALANAELLKNGIQNHQISKTPYCTYEDENLFYSYRRDGKDTGRMLSLIWLDDQNS